MRAARLPDIGSEIPRSGGLVSRAFGRVVLRAMGWCVDGAIPNVPKFIVIVAPNTSNWDFVVGLSAKLALGMRVTFLAKDSLFRFPFGPAMRALGGVPVDRAAPHDVVPGMVAEFGMRDRMILGLAPEGTRKRVDRWRTGFYHIARGAGVPILPVALNWGTRSVEIGALFTPAGDLERDVGELQRRFASVPGRNAKT